MKKIFGAIAKWIIAGAIFTLLAICGADVFENLCLWTRNILIDMGLRRSQSDWIATAVWIWSLTTFCKFAIDFAAEMFKKRRRRRSRSNPGPLGFEYAIIFSRREDPNPMTFSEFCLKDKPQKKERGLTMADLGGEKKSARPIYEREVVRLRSIITEFPIEDDVFFEKISIVDENQFEKISYGPDDEAYLLGRSRRGVWVVCDGCDIYIVARTRKFEQSARVVAANITKAIAKVFRYGYSVTGCWAM